MTTTHLDIRIDAMNAVVDRELRPATIGVIDGRIEIVAEFGTKLAAERIVRMGDAVALLPGLVDTHVHINEPGHPDWEGFDSATRSAAAGGITTLVDMPLDSLPVTTDTDALHLKRVVARNLCHVDVGFWAGLVPGNLDQLAALHDAGAMGFKCFLADSGTPQFPPVDSATLVKAMDELAELGAVLLVHAESADELAAAPRASGRSYAGFLASRPPAVEERAVAVVIDAVRRTGARAHIVHVSSASVLPAIAAARAEGLPLTAETCPHYLSLRSDRVPDGATEFACAPPIRDEANCDALWAALADGTLDMVVSDHSPCAAELKFTASGDFGRAWGGISSLQLGLSLVWTQAWRRGFGLADVVRWMAEQPALLAGLMTKGRIAAGAVADFCVFDPLARFVVDPPRLFHRQTLTPYAGMALRGSVRETWLAGVRIDPGGDEPRGQLLQRDAQLLRPAMTTRVPRP